MELGKKRKIEDNGDSNCASPPSLAAEEIHKILVHFTQDQLLHIVKFAALNHRDVLDAVRSVANSDSTFRKLFVRGLGGYTTNAALHAAFSSFGPIEEAVIIFDKETGRSKGYGFVTFRHVDGAVLALKEPSKKINGRMAFAQLAYFGVWRSESSVRERKIFIGNVSFDISAERLLSYFERYGEVEEGPLGFERVDGKPKGFAFIVYKSKNGAREALLHPTKVIDGHQVHCRFTVESHRVKPAVTPTDQGFGMSTSNHHHRRRHYQQQQLSSLHSPPLLGMQQSSSFGNPPQGMFQGMSPYY